MEQRRNWARAIVIASSTNLIECAVEELWEASWIAPTPALLMEAWWYPYVEAGCLREVRAASLRPKRNFGGEKCFSAAAPGRLRLQKAGKRAWWYVNNTKMQRGGRCGGGRASVEVGDKFGKAETFGCDCQRPVALRGCSSCASRSLLNVASSPLLSRAE